MKKSILIILISIFLSYPMNLIGGDFDTPHRFSAGDTISADVMNEIFDYIKNANKMISASELIGTWSCTIYTQTSGCPLLSTLGTDSLFRYNSTTLVMIDDEDGTYSYTSTIPNIFNCADDSDNGTGLGNWVVKNNVLFVDVYKWGIKGDPSYQAQLRFVNLKKVSDSKLILEIDDTKKVFAECDKQNIPPNNPRNFTASASGMTVSLAWTDNSTDETGFKVLRKDTLTGSFSTVTTTAADATSYSENVTAAGTYKYRVSATNGYGDSTGSTVVEVVVE